MNVVVLLCVVGVALAGPVPHRHKLARPPGPWGPDVSHYQVWLGII
jgi:hypothetical protein